MKSSVVITFDDGYHNFYTDAFLVLNRYGFTATMFLLKAHIAGAFEMMDDRTTRRNCRSCCRLR